jgi:membrane associated rhomboid family serine protease
MTPTSVGMRCPECSKQHTMVYRGPRSVTGEPVVTFALIGICVLAFIGSGLGSQTNEIYQQGSLLGIGLDQTRELIGVHEGQYWRLLTGAFLHASFIHIAFNMYLLFILGRMFEPRWGSARFASIYFAALFCGSLGALVQTTVAPTIGASGAIFGLMGAALVQLHADGEDPFRTDIGFLVIINLGLGFVLSGVSIGGHIGGLIGGVAVMSAIRFADSQRLPRWSAYGICVVIAVAAIVASIAISGNIHNHNLSLN